MVKRNLGPWLFCLPAIIAVLLVAGWPLLRTFYFAFTDANFSNLTEMNWVGLENFAGIIDDPDWWQSVWNTVWFTGFAVFFETLLGLMVALVLNSQFKGRGALRAAVLIPWAIPTVVSAKMWAWMFNDSYGIINEMLISMGFISQGLAWLADDNLAMITVIVVDVWKTTPFMALLLLAGLQSVPQNVYEAARIDGASSVRQFFSITLPLIRPALLVAVLFRVLDSLRIFDLPYILTSNSKATSMMSVFARQQLVDFSEFGYGSAASFMIFCMIGVMTVIYLAFGRKALGLKS